MDFEIEFLPVGEGTRAGDAIFVRYVDEGGQRIMVIDGGTDASGERLVKHIESVCGPNAVVNDIISTHPDTDHSCGLRAVLKAFPVERLWVHGLWHHTAEMMGLFKDHRWTPEGLATAIRASYPVVGELIDLAQAQGTEIYEPWEGQAIGPFTVLSPQKATYVHLVPQFRKTPDANVEELKARNIWLAAPKSSVFAQMFEAAADAAQSFIHETWDFELLKGGGVTAAENESSVVLYGSFGGTDVLLTGDAGINALVWAAENAVARGIDVQRAELVQIPHHGSRRNVSPEVLDLIVGPRLPFGSPERKKAIVSAPKDDAKHPRLMVVNAFTRRGAGVRSTQGVQYRFHSGTMPARPGEKAATVLPFYDRVEAYD